MHVMDRHGGYIISIEYIYIYIYFMHAGGGTLSVYTCMIIDIFYLQLRNFY